MIPSVVNLRIHLMVLLLTSYFLTLAQEPEGYYTSAHGLSGVALKTALHGIIKGHTAFPYTAATTDVWDILKETDRDAANPENVILFYSGWSVNAAQEYNSGLGWTREQVWAKSHGDFDTGKGVGTDVHHIRPVDLSVNSARNNKDFDYGGSPYVDGDGPTECCSDADSWEPRAAVKGDVARMLFYMVVRYEGENDEPDLELMDETNTIEYTLPGKGFHGKLSALLEWHESDPVDSFEIRRNEIIYSYQKNRNPFIDHPEFVKKLWPVTGIERVKELPFLVCPNPAKEFLTVSCNLLEPFEISLLSMNGKTLLLGSFTGMLKFSVADFPEGLYLVRITNQHLIFTEKVIIER